MSIKTNSDEQLMLMYASGDAQAFEELYSRYGGRLYNLFLRSLTSAEAAQDLLQECFVRVIKAKDRYKPQKVFSNWIFTIAMNLLRDNYREQARRKVDYLDDMDRLELSEARQDEQPHSELEKSRMKRAVVAAINELPVDQREVLVLSKFDEFSFSEIAEVLGLSSAAAKQKAYRAMQNLRKKLAHLQDD